MWQLPRLARRERRAPGRLAALALAFVCSLLPLGCPAEAPPPEGSRLEIVSEGLEHPWGLAFLPGGESALITERAGRLSRVDLTSGQRTVLGGTPEVATVGQGGLLDVRLHPAFADNGLVYLTWAGANDDGQRYATHLGRARLEGDDLVELEVLHVATPFLSGGQHFGSRIAFDDEGYVYFTAGERNERERAQALDEHMGSVMRLHDDGRVPEDNPFVDEAGAAPALYTYGHRNPQGLALHPETRRLWLTEHGPSGGDEVNLLEPGANYGWPLASYGVEYGIGTPIGPDPHELEGSVPPIHWWESSFAPSGMAFYAHDAFPDWRGDLFVGSLVRRYLARLVLDGDTVVREERLLEGRDWRVRDVRVGPEGGLYLLIDDANAPLVRLVPDDA